MKEETPIQRHPDDAILYHGEARVLESSHPPSDPPGPRFKHQSFFYKGRLYVHGGTTIPAPDFSDDPLDLHSYQVEGEGRWQRVRTRAAAGKQVEAVSAHAGVVNGNKWYVFGGSNSDCRPNNHLLRLNLDTYEWTRLEQKGEAPAPRESAFLAFVEKNWLLLYGGISTCEVEIYNTFHFYNLDTRNWSTCEGAYQYQLYARLDPALCHFRDRLYLFGGTYRTINNEERYLNDFYEIAVAPPARNQTARVQVKRLAAPTVPEGRSGHSLVALGENHLVLVGGENTCSQLREGARFEDVSLVDNMWLFDTRSGVWGRLELGRSFRFRSMASCLAHNDKLYLFGGLHSYSAVLKDFVEIAISPRDLAQPRKIAVPCPQCIERERFPLSVRHVSAAVIEDVAEGIDFPFAAVGLLVDNSMNSGASLLKISYFHAYGSQKLRLLKLEDDAKLNWTDEELLETLTHFNAGQMYAPSGTDKKIKAGLMKEAFRREYGYNLKVASLRLGQGFLFLSYNEDQNQFRVCLFEKEGANSPAARYSLHFYTYNMFDRKATTPDMQSVHQRITARFGDILDSVFFQRKCRNTLVVLNPRVQDAREAGQAGDDEMEMKADIENGNLLNGPILKVKELQRAGFFVQECVDISLRAYLTCLYLKNQCMKIMLSVRQKVQTQAFLEKVDRLCKHKHVLEINPALQFDLKISELYYLYDLRRKLSFFNNGLLIYHKNRLLTRFKYPLGELLLRKYYKRHHCHNFLRLFGFIELPDHIPVNFLKTTYLHHVMMERLFSRLKLIGKLFKRELARMAADPDYRRPAPTRLNEEEAQQDRIEVSEPKPPRVRKNELAPREISLRRRKTPQRDSLEGRLKHLLKDPTSDNIKEIIKLIEANSSNKQEELAYFHRKKHLLLGPNAPVGRPLSCKTLLREKEKEEQERRELLEAEAAFAAVQEQLFKPNEYRMEEKQGEAEQEMVDHAEMAEEKVDGQMGEQDNLAVQKQDNIAIQEERMEEEKQEEEQAMAELEEVQQEQEQQRESMREQQQARSQEQEVEEREQKQAQDEEAEMAVEEQKQAVEVMAVEPNSADPLNQHNYQSQHNNQIPLREDNLIANQKNEGLHN